MYGSIYLEVKIYISKKNSANKIIQGKMFDVDNYCYWQGMQTHIVYSLFTFYKKKYLFGNFILLTLLFRRHFNDVILFFSLENFIVRNHAIGCMLIFDTRGIDGY